MFGGYPPTANGYTPTAIGYPPTAIGYPPTAIGYTPMAISYTPMAISYPPTAIRYPPAAIIGRIGHSEFFFFSLWHPLPCRPQQGRPSNVGLLRPPRPPPLCPGTSNVLPRTQRVVLARGPGQPRAVKAVLSGALRMALMTGMGTNG